MIQLGRKLNLAIEPFDTDFRRKLRWKHFENNLSSELSVCREKHVGHPAMANLILHVECIAERALETFAKLRTSFVKLISRFSHGAILTPPSLQRLTGKGRVVSIRGIQKSVAFLLGLAACSSSTGERSSATLTPPGGDVVTPYPIDRGDDGHQTPGTYKGLPLRLVDNGSPTVTAVDGVIGVVCIGMSNAKLECDDYRERVRNQYASAINPGVRVINCSVGGHAIERWIDPEFDADLWDRCISTLLPQAGVRLDQVRVIWHKAADQFTVAANNTPFPLYPSAGSDYENFRANLNRFAARVKSKFPYVQAVYTSSRSYGGYAGSIDRGEPVSYEEGHALNTWLASNPKVDGVWYGWGPYLWAPACSSGITNKGGVCYDRADFVNDGVHPSASGTAKISGLIHARFLTESWYKR